MNTAAWINFSPIVSKVIFAYSDPSITSGKINFLSYVFMIVYLPFNFVSIWIIEKKGVRVSVLTAVFMQAVGMWLRVFIKTSFAYVIAGQTLIAIAQPLLYNLPAKISGVWFPQKERLLSTMVGVNFVMFGAVVGFLFPGVVVTQDFDTTEPESKVREKM